MNPPMLSRGRAAVLGASVYFAMGISGLYVQPVALVLKERMGQGAFDAAVNLFVAGIGWLLKPLFGLIADTFPIRGQRRKPYLVLGFLIASGAACMAAIFSVEGQRPWLIAQLALMNVGLALVDVSIDGLLVEGGRKLQSTKVLQSGAWISMKLAMALAGLLGGWFASLGAFRLPMLLCCGLFMVAALLVTFLVREERVSQPGSQRVSLERPHILQGILRSPAFWMVAAFVFVGRVVPSPAKAIFYFQTDVLHLGQTAIGLLDAVEKGSSVLAGILYLPLTRRRALPSVLFGALALSAVTRWLFLFYANFPAAILLEALSGISAMVLFLAILDMCARVCPKSAEATGFAILMGLYGLGLRLGTLMGSWIYERAGFQVLVIGSGFLTLGLLALVRWLPVQELADESPNNGSMVLTSP
jgi:Na+/melibiose symporter-like transporter